MSSRGTGTDHTHSVVAGRVEVAGCAVEPRLPRGAPCAGNPLRRALRQSLTMGT
jgi:hypothetical protein